MFELSEKDYQRFCKYIEIGEDGILRWIGAKDSCGYGLFYLKGKLVKAHRLAFFLWGDTEFAPELHVLHKIDDPAIVDCRYLFQGTHSDNMADRNAKGRTAVGSAHGRSKYSESEVLEVRRLGASGQYTHEQIATMTGMSRSHVAKIINRKRWTHI